MADNKTEKKLNDNLSKAKQAKNDEFYTQIKDIENELVHYRKHFKNKVIFLNCDDPKESNFWQYFILNFNFLGIKKVIATHFSDSESTYKLEYGLNDNGQLELKQHELKGNGDFRSPEAVELLEEADIVVTNPPFSLFREYIAQLIEHNKKFVVMGAQNALTYKEIFPLIRDGKLWTGYANNVTMEFEVPNNENYADGWGWRVDKETGKAYRKMRNIIWFTNLEIPKRNEDLILWKTYNKKDFPQYDNFEAIEVSTLKDIPKDYAGVMGVPITFFNVHNPKQFDILGCSYSYGRPVDWDEETNMNVSVNGTNVYKRVLIQRTQESLEKQAKEEAEFEEV